MSGPDGADWLLDASTQARTRPQDPPSSVDAKICRLLAMDGRMSFTELGRQTGLSTSAVHQRVKRLEKRGAIRGYIADVEPEQFGLTLSAFVSIRPIDSSQADDAPDRLAHIPEIEACYSVAGDESYILHVRVRDPRALEDLLATIRKAANVSTRTTIVLSTPYERRPPRSDPSVARRRDRIDGPGLASASPCEPVAAAPGGGYALT